MDFPFFKKALLPVFDGFVDYHSHILPGVDDGVRTFEDSKRILEEYSRLGVRKVYLTPHV
ncbi:MAG: CpsB/CapC family capsule biosynthesis tyrosine phosphatase, partial [Candidatus Cryptobacteroides sp.]